MAEYFIDFNRGADGNAGTTSGSGAWKNLSKLAGTFADGDIVVLDDESRWDITDRAVAGTIAGRFTIVRSGTNGSQKPTISYKFSSVAANWTYSDSGDGSKNGWYYDIGYLPGVMAWIRLGGEHYAVRQEAAFPLGSVDYTWKESGNRIYLYAPAGMNPVDYYGSVEIGPANRGAITFSSDGTDVVIDGLRFEEGGTGILLYNGSGIRRYAVRNCEARDLSPLVFANADTAGQMSVLVEDNVCDLGVSAFIHTYTASADRMGQSIFRRNRLSRANAAYPQGAIYCQSRAGSIVYENIIEDCYYGSVHHQYDGCGIYTEIQSDNALVFGNLIRNCHMAMQDNSGRNAVFAGNVIVDCHTAMKQSDFSTAGAANHRFYNNTIIRAGTPVPTRGPLEEVGIGWRGSTDATPNFDVTNNVFTAHPDAASDYPINTPTSYTTGAIRNNLAYGFAGVAQLFGGGSSSPVPTGSLTSDPILDSNYRPLAGSPCIGAGVYIPGAKHMGGMPMNASSPDIGAYRYQVERSIALSRAI